MTMNEPAVRDTGAEAILAALGSVLPDEDKPYALHEPLLAGKEWNYVQDCLDSGWISYAGPYVGQFEDMLAKACGVKHAVAAVSGTAALHIALKITGAGADDEVIMPALTFVASANAVTYCGAAPHFAEIDRTTLGIDPARLAEHLLQIAKKTDAGAVNTQTGRRIAAIMPVHVFGHPVDMDALNEVAAEYGISVIEDAAEAIGSLYKGRKAGSLAAIAALSFNGNKIVTTGGGGAILTDDEDLARRAKHLTTTAKLPHKWAFEHDEIGYNYRLPALNAALGCAQLERLDEFIRAKRKLAASYEKAFTGADGVSFFREPGYAQSNYWLNAVFLDDAGAREDILAALHEAGYLCRPAWKPMHQLSFFADCPRMDLSVTEDMACKLINLPSSPGLGQGL